MAFAFCGAEGMRVLKSTQGLLATLRGTGHLFVSMHRHFVRVAKEMD